MASTREIVARKLRRVREFIHDARELRQTREQIAALNARLDKLEARRPDMISMETIDYRRDENLFVPTQALFREYEKGAVEAAPSSFSPTNAQQGGTGRHFAPFQGINLSSPGERLDNVPLISPAQASRPSSLKRHYTVSMVPLTPTVRELVLPNPLVSEPARLEAELESEQRSVGELKEQH